MSVLERALDMRMRAHEIHTSNIANANVPGFKARNIDFEQSLREALQPLEQEAEPMLAREKDAANRLAQVTPDVYEDPNAKMNGAGNTVNQEKEQTSIQKNAIAYQLAIELINRKFAMARTALGEGGR